MRRSRRSRRRGSRSNGWLIVAGVACVTVLMVGLSLSAVSYSATNVPRGSTVDVTSDSVAVHTLDTAQAVHVNETSTLVNVTNNLGRQTTVTVALREDSTHIGDLVVDGQNQGNRTSFTLTADATETVAITVPDDSSLTDDVVYFHANATATGLAVGAPNRSAPVNA